MQQQSGTKLEYWGLGDIGKMHVFQMLSRGIFLLWLVVLEFVLLLFIHNCTSNLLTFKLSGEEGRK